MSKRNYSTARGTRDFGPIEMSQRRYIIEKIKKQFIRYGFSEIETPAIENLATLTDKYGEEGDQLLFKILNSGNYLDEVTEENLKSGTTQFTPLISNKGLRYDLTIPFARYVTSHQHEISFPFRRFQIQPVWRADRPQKGRYREFYQCDADIIGTTHLWNETELILLVLDIFHDLKIESFEVRVNHRNVLTALASYVGLKGKEALFFAELDKLNKIGAQKVSAALMTYGAIEKDLKNMFKLFENPTLNLGDLKEIIKENKGLEELNDVFEKVKKMRSQNKKVVFDPSLARGMSYYTGTIFEVKATNSEIGSLCGGGRYDNLTSIFGLENVSGVGISFGLDRIYDVMLSTNIPLEDTDDNTKVLILHTNKEAFEHGVLLLDDLRKHGLKCHIYADEAKLKKQFSYANKISAPFTLIIGEDEIKSKCYRLKNMKDGNEILMSFEKIVNFFNKKN